MNLSKGPQDQEQRLTPTVVVSEPLRPAATSRSSISRWQKRVIYPELLDIDRCLQDEHGMGNRQPGLAWDSIPESNWFIG